MISLKSMDHYSSERELLSIIRRIDTDGDAKLSLAEYSDYLRSHNLPSRYEMIEDSIKARSYSEEKRRRNLAASSSYYASPSKSHYEPAGSPLRPRSADPYSRNKGSYSTPTKQHVPLRESYLGSGMK